LKILLLGKNGQVGWELQRSLAPLGELVAPDRQGPEPRGDLSDLSNLAATVQAVRPDVIVNAAAHTAVDQAESEPERAHVLNAAAPGVLALEARACNAWLIHYSTDYVFDGRGSRPWTEDSPMGPLGVYGATKLAGERAIRDSGCPHLILRTSWVYAARGRNFLRTMLKLAGERDSIAVVDDQYGAPTGAELLADATAHALRTLFARPELGGTYHLAAAGETTWHGYACHAIEYARRAGAPVRVAPDAVRAVATSAFTTAAQRPANSRLDTTKFRAAFDIVLPDWRSGVDRALSELMGH
jgi:dTDP-4-dehydrorhamnose reductase